MYLILVPKNIYPTGSYRFRYRRFSWQ